jgi:phosphoribosyl 1,2-cyclic phosphate phosphodiesterase
LGGPNIRRRSSALVETDLLIDFGPDVMAASADLDVPLHTVRYVLQTHEHDDHLDISHFFSRSSSCGVPEVQVLTWLASSSAARRAASLLRDGATTDLFQQPELIEKLSLVHRGVTKYGRTDIGPYRIFSVPAIHGDGIDALLHAVERDGRRLFYATDTGTLPSEVWITLASEGWVFDVVAMDHTFGTMGRSGGHLNGEQFREHIAAMKQHGLLHENSRIFATHIAHHSNPLHDELVAMAARHGYEVAFDGLVVNV